jgi:hypothetical protein
MPNKRSKPNWGRPFRFAPVSTEFEMQVTQLQLAPEAYVFSPQLRIWCKSNRNRCYIPEWLLKAWDIPVNTDLGAA